MVPLNIFHHNQAKKKLPIYMEKEEIMDVNYISGQFDSQKERNMTIVRGGSRVKRKFQNN